MGVVSSSLRSGLGVLRGVGPSVLYPLFYAPSGGLGGIVSAVEGALSAVGDIGYAGGSLLGVAGYAAEVEILTAAADHVKGLESFVGSVVSSGESFVLSQWGSFLGMCDSFIDRVECLEDAMSELRVLCVKVVLVSGVLTPAGESLLCQMRSSVNVLGDIASGLLLSYNLLVQSVRQGGFDRVLGRWVSEDSSGDEVVEEGCAIVQKWLSSVDAVLLGASGLINSVIALRDAVYGLKLGGLS